MVVQPVTFRDCPAAFLPLTRARTEMASMLYLDRDGKEIGARWFDSRRLSSVDVPFRPVVVDALALDAATVVMAHNHPSGDVTPSQLDLNVTRDLHSALGAVGVRLHDHLIVSAVALMSFRAARLL